MCACACACVCCIVRNGRQALVQGRYLYYHYLMGGIDDSVRHIDLVSSVFCQHILRAILVVFWLTFGFLNLHIYLVFLSFYMGRGLWDFAPVL